MRALTHTYTHFVCIPTRFCDAHCTPNILRINFCQAHIHYNGQWSLVQRRTFISKATYWKTWTSIDYRPFSNLTHKNHIRTTFHRLNCFFLSFCQHKFVKRIFYNWYVFSLCCNISSDEMIALWSKDFSSPHFHRHFVKDKDFKTPRICLKKWNTHCFTLKTKVVCGWTRLWIEVSNQRYVRHFLTGRNHDDQCFEHTT